MMNDELCVVHPRAAGLDIHKGHITATVRLSEATAGPPQCETRMFSALASGLAALVAWLTSHRVVAAAMEATGVYWHTPWQALTDAGINAQLLHAQLCRRGARRRRRDAGGRGDVVDQAAGFFLQRWESGSARHITRLWRGERQRAPGRPSSDEWLMWRRTLDGWGF